MIASTLRNNSLMFKFNFNNEEEFSNYEVCCPKESFQWYESKKVEIPTDIVEIVKGISQNAIVQVDYNCGVIFSCLSTRKVINTLKKKSENDEFLDVLKADKKHSDLLPGIYEGGLKTWECTKDLIVYFMKHVVKGMENSFAEKTFLDLGCGSGLLGIMCLSLGGCVTFQDYNQEVLEAMTIPNIFLNCNSSVERKVELYSGDWSSFLNLMIQEIEKHGKEKFDYILTSETIYNPENYRKVIAIIKRLLKPGGTAFVAAKRYYFGVGGNLTDFETLLHSEGLLSNVCWNTEEGVSRGILEVKLF